MTRASLYNTDRCTLKTKSVGGRIPFANLALRLSARGGTWTYVSRSSKAGHRNDAVMKAGTAHRDLNCKERQERKHTFKSLTKIGVTYDFFYRSDNMMPHRMLSRELYEAKRKAPPSFGLRYPSVKLGLGSTNNGYIFKPNHLFSLWFWSSHVFFEIKMAWQRLTRGYDDLLVWNLGNRLCEFTIRGLLHMADYHNDLPDIEDWQELPDEEQSRFWEERLAEIADHLYESLEHEDSQYEKNEYNGYTEEQVEDLSEKWRGRNREINAYKAEQRKIGINKLLDVFDHLWF